MINLEDIDNPSFIKTLNKKELKQLTKDIRQFLIDNVSKTGGHLSSNLGVVELTVAMFYVFDAESDSFIYDVGHQSYIHKILTGRAKNFNTLRSFKGMSGYINRAESKYDIWESGHSSTSISAAAGIMIARKNDPSFGRPIVIIGDSSISNGIAFEGINFLGSLKEANPIIILNDNKMGITKSVGSMAKVFGRLRGSKLWRRLKKACNILFPKIITNRFHQIKRGIKGYFQQDNIFEDLGFDYYGPIDGNDLNAVVRNFERVKLINKPILVHLITKKGFGYPLAEDDDYGNFHGVSPFDIETGKPIKQTTENEVSYSKIVATTLVNYHKHSQFFVITPAMKAGAELELFASLYPNDFFDVGISEEHAAVMAAGMSLSHKKVVLLMYSTFAQRAYDNFLNDICRQNLDMIIGIDRAGVVGEDGSTHQGIFDVSMFNSMPNITICMPKDGKECVGLFHYAFEHKGPIVIRYPRGKDILNIAKVQNYKVTQTWERILTGNKAVVITYGPSVNRIKTLALKNDLDIILINARFIRPVDEAILKEVLVLSLPILVIEECVNVGTLFDNIAKFTRENHYDSSLLKSYGLSQDVILPHGSIQKVLDAYGFSNEDFLRIIKELYEN